MSLFNNYRVIAGLFTLLFATVTSVSIDAAPWIMRHGLSADQYQEFYDNELPPGYRPISVNGNGPTAEPHFAGVWINDGNNSPWVARHGLTSAEYQAETDALDAQGFRVLCVDAYGEYPNEQYVAVWINDGVSDADWVARHRMTSAAFQAEFDTWDNAGFRMIWMSAVGSGSNTRFAAAWIRNTESWSSPVSWGQTASEYQTLVEDFCRSGYRPTCITAYGSNSDPRFGVIFLRPDGANFELQPEWLARHGQPDADYQQLVDDLSSTTFQSQCVIEYGSTSDPHYASAWFADRGPATFTTTGTPVPQLSTLDDVMEDFMTTRKIPHGSLAVTKDGRLVLSRAYTYAPSDEPPTQTDNMFRIASVAKPITAIGIMQLVENGIIDLDDTIDDFPELDVISWCDPVVSRVSVRNMLQHAGGWDSSCDPNDGDPAQVRKCGGDGAPMMVNCFDPMFSDFSIRDELGVTLPVNHFNIFTYTALFDLVHQPGTVYAYSNFGYSVLGRIIEAASGQTYEDYIRENVLCPVGAQGVILGRSLWEDRDPREVVYSEPMRRCSTSRFDGISQVPWQYGGFNVENFDSHGGWTGSAVQLVRVANAFTDTANSPLLSQSSIDTMWAASSVNSGYGMGWVRGSDSGISTRYHNGSIPGTWSYMVRRDDGVCFAVLFNQRSSDTNSPYTDDDWQIRRDLNNAMTQIGAAGGPGWPSHNFFGYGWITDLNCDGTVDLSDLAGLLGKYGLHRDDPGYEIRYDFDQDGVIGLSDLALLLSAYGDDL